MTNLVTLVALFVILNGFVHSYPSRSLNQQTERQKRCHFLDNYETILLNDIKNNTRPTEVTYRNREKNNETLITSGSRSNSGSMEDQDSITEYPTIEHKKRKNWESKLNRLNLPMIWRSPRIESQELPNLYILRTNAYEY